MVVGLPGVLLDFKIIKILYASIPYGNMIGDPSYFPEFMEFVGPEHCHINTDWGQPIAMDPVDGYRLFVRMLMHWGFSKEDIRTMVHTNPEKFLYLQ